MCGIIGIVGRSEAAPLLIAGLQRLEYRGYDSAGLATLASGEIQRRRSQGKVANLAARLVQDPVIGRSGIAHTRWATHGRPSETNAHPIATDRVAVVHNGIIENYKELRRELEGAGEHFYTETDTETVAVLLTRYLREGMTPSQAVVVTLPRLTGTFALAILFTGYDDLIICARRGSPLAIAYADGEMFVGSDALALGPLSRRICYLDDGDWAILTPTGAVIHDGNGRCVQRETKSSAAAASFADKGSHQYYMHKEIFEQPEVIRDTVAALIDPAARQVRLPAELGDLSGVDRAVIVACGTSYHAGLVAKYWLESIAGLPTDVEVASEFRYRNPALAKACLFIGITQSGETADTLAAVRYAKALGHMTLGIVNQPESAITREAHAVLYTKAGPEISVASTKAFTTQLAVLACLAIAVGRARGTVSIADERALVEELSGVPALLAEALERDDCIQKAAQDIVRARDVLYLGRGTTFPIALEAALKLKEISYIHAEGYPAGELKHGPIALIDQQVPVVVLAPPDGLFEKTISNLHEVMARGAPVTLISSRAGIDRLGNADVTSIAMPECGILATPILYTIPVQLLAYHAAVLRKTDVDQPRNLAKSVTVE
jgi:glutamine---fructose-6-phosphate transaminase (isomerizing)